MDLPSEHVRPERNNPKPTRQKLKSRKNPRKPIFPDLNSPREFKNFMSPMNHKFPFQIAKKRDGLVGKFAFKNNDIF